MTWTNDPPFILPPDPEPRAGELKAALRSGPPAGLNYPDHWWDERHWKALQQAERYRAFLSGVKLPEPDYSKAPQEIQELLEYQLSPERERRRAEILEEADHPPPYYKRALMLDEIRGPKTWALLAQSVGWAVPFIMHFKHHWKRPRPSQLDPQISPMIDCPCHPAYPSGHSTQAHLVALVVGKISGRDDIFNALWAKADRIAQNREYAGIHYSSDSAAGVALSKAIFPLFEQEYGGQMAAAKKAEWDLW